MMKVVVLALALIVCAVAAAQKGQKVPTVQPKQRVPTIPSNHRVPSVQPTKIILKTTETSSAPQEHAVETEADRANKLSRNPILSQAICERSMCKSETSLDEPDAFYMRNEGFNVVQPRPETVYELKHLLGDFSPCLNLELLRVQIGKKQLSPNFQKIHSKKNVIFDEGIVSQSITAPYKATFNVTCQSKPATCTVTIPCVHPRVFGRYRYNASYNGEDVTGCVNWSIDDMPIDISVNISMNVDKKCKILGPDKDRLITRYYYPTMFPAGNLGGPEYHVSDILYSYNFPDIMHSIYIEEIKNFATRSIQEAFSESYRVFSPLEELHKYCTELN